jgi:TRAP-type uncharacterized transport system substrate-binding protein
MSSVTQLAGKRIWMGAENSGSLLSATAVLQAAGLDLSRMPSLVASLDSRKALALLRLEERKDGELVAFIDKAPDQEVVSDTLASAGIRKQVVKYWSDAPPVNVLLAPDLRINGLADLKQSRFQILAGCCSRQAAELAEAGVFPDSSAENVNVALSQLAHKEIDALIMPEPLDRDSICAILQMRGVNLMPLVADPRTGGKDNLMIFVRPGQTVSSALDLVMQGKMKIWWPDKNHVLEEAVLRALIPDDSGPEVNARRVSLRQIDRGINITMALDLLSLGELDAVFQTTIAPDQRISDLVSTTEVGFLGIDWPMVDRLDHDGTYVETSLQPRAYSYLEQSVYTVGVQTLLLTGLDQSKGNVEKVRFLARFLRDHQSDIEKQLQGQPPQGAGPSSLTLVGAPVRKQLKEHIYEPVRPLLVMGQLRPTTLFQLVLLASGIVLLGIVALRLERGRQLTAHHCFKILFVLTSVLLLCIGAIWLQAVEGEISQDFVSLPAASLSILRTVLANCRLPMTHPEPTTRLGQSIMDVFSWIGVALAGAFWLPYLKSIWKNKIMPTLETWEGLQTPKSTGRQVRSKTARDEAHPPEMARV